MKPLNGSFYIYKIFLVLMQRFLLIKITMTLGFGKLGAMINQDSFKMQWKGLLFFLFNYYLIQSYSKSIQLNPNDDIAWNNKGLALNKYEKY